MLNIHAERVVENVGKVLSIMTVRSANYYIVNYVYRSKFDNYHRYQSVCIFCTI